MEAGQSARNGWSHNLLQGTQLSSIYSVMKVLTDLRKQKQKQNKTKASKKANKQTKTKTKQTNKQTNKQKNKTKQNKTKQNRQLCGLIASAALVVIVLE